MIRLPWWSAVLVVLSPAWSFGGSPPPYQADFPPEEFRARWNTVFERIGDEAVAIVQGVPKANGFLVPRQSNEFYHLCGIATPHAYLVLDGRDRKVTLLLPPRDERLERAEGKVLSAEDAELVKRLTGVDEVTSTMVMNDEWTRGLMLAPRTVVFTPFAPAEGNAQSRGELMSANAAIARNYWDGRPPREARLVQLLKARLP